jgi:hypothetical protein
MYGFNQNTPKGLQPSQYLNGSTWSGQTGQYYVLSGYANSLFQGDPVTMLNTGGIGIGVAGSGIIGVFWGVTYQDSTGNYVYSPFWTTGTVTFQAQPAIAYVIDDPNVLFDIQIASSAGALVDAPGLTLTQLNNNANFALGAGTTYNPVNGVTPLTNPTGGSTLTGQSAFYLDSTTIQTGQAAFSLKIIRLTPNPTNVFFSAGPPIVGAFNNALVLINNDIYKGGTGTVGI